MAFFLRNDTEQWFSHIKDQKPYIETKFDLYYFCLMLGLASGEKHPVTGKSEATEFQKNFVKAFIPVQKLIIGLLIKAELRRLGINATEKDQVYDLLTEIVDPDSPTKLTEAGITKLNEYASGGYDVLSEELPTKPYNVEDFLRTYTALLKQKALYNSTSI
jgi:hypothetical protein